MRRSGIVLEEDLRRGLDGQALGPGVRGADEGVRGVRVDEGAVEQAEPELLQQQPAGGDAQPGLADAAGADEVHEHLRAELAAELVDAGVQGLDHAVFEAEVLDAPERARQDAPVGADDAVEAELVAQQVGDDLAVEAEADLLVLGADRHAVVGHQLGDAGLDQLAEGLQVLGEPAARIDLLAPVGEVRILAVQLRAAAGEMLGHGGHGLATEPGPPQAADVGRAEASGHLGARTERLQLPRPARLGAQVDLRVERDPDADREVLATDEVGEPLDQCFVVEGREAEQVGELRERAREQRGGRVVREGVPRIARQRHRNAGAAAQGFGLDGVVPLGDLAGRGRGEDVHVVDPAVEDLPGRRRAHHARGVEVADGRHRLEHQARLVLEFEAVDEIGDPGLGVEGRVLVRVLRFAHRNSFVRPVVG